MDMYLPGPPAVTSDLGATASSGQLSITTCLLGLAAGQLVFGPLSDMIGRRKPLITTLIFYTIISILCGFSTHIWMFIMLLFLLVFTVVVGIVIARALARYMYA